MKKYIFLHYFYFIEISTLLLQIINPLKTYYENLQSEFIDILTHALTHFKIRM